MRIALALGQMVSARPRRRRCRRSGRIIFALTVLCRCVWCMVYSMVCVLLGVGASGGKLCLGVAGGCRSMRGCLWRGALRLFRLISDLRLARVYIRDFFCCWGDESFGRGCWRNSFGVECCRTMGFEGVFIFMRYWTFCSVANGNMSDLLDDKSYALG